MSTSKIDALSVDSGIEILQRQANALRGHRVVYRIAQSVCKRRHSGENILMGAGRNAEVITGVGRADDRGLYAIELYRLARCVRAVGDVASSNPGTRRCRIDVVRVLAAKRQRPVVSRGEPRHRVEVTARNDRPGRYRHSKRGRRSR